MAVGKKSDAPMYNEVLTEAKEAFKDPNKNPNLEQAKDVPWDDTEVNEENKLDPELI